MHRWGLIIDGVVREIIEAEQLPPLHADIAKQFEILPDGVEEHWVKSFSDGVFYPPKVEVPVEERKRSAYQRSGCTIEKLVIALWEAYAEDKPEKMLKLKEKRQQVKQQFKE